jgi:hypothetical protein
MRIYTSPVIELIREFLAVSAPALPERERSRMCEVPSSHAHFVHTVVLLMPSRPFNFQPRVMLPNCCAVMARAWNSANGVVDTGERIRVVAKFRFFSNRFEQHDG